MYNIFSHYRTVINNVGLRKSGLQNVHFKKKEFFGGLEDISIGNMKMTIILVHFVNPHKNGPFGALM
jgi:hypothetical protein